MNSKEIKNMLIEEGLVSDYEIKDIEASAHVKRHALIESQRNVQLGLISGVLDVDIMSDVAKERVRQLELWGEQTHAPEVWMVIAQEEFGEVAQAIQKTQFTWSKETDKGEMYEELIQTIAVLIAFAEDIKK